MSQGGNGFPCLAEAVYEYMTTGKYTNIDVSTVKTMQRSKYHFPWMNLLFEAHYQKPIQHISVDDKASVLIDYHLIIKVKCYIDQFMSGLETLGVLSRLQHNPLLWKPFFVRHNQELTTGKCNIRYL